MNTPPQIFISYRRSDTAGHAFALWRELGRHFGNAALFFDRDEIHLHPGRRWDDGLRAAIDGACICLVVIGPDWLTVLGSDGQRRLDDPTDAVRREVAQALAWAERGKSREVLVIPILFNGAIVPPAEQLPADLQGLPARQAAAFHLDLDFDVKFQRLVDKLVDHSGLPLRPEPGAHRQVCHLPGQKPSAFFADPTGKLPQLEQTLHRQGSAAVLAVHGMGGVGKTQLALQYVKEQRKNYYGIWWFRAENTALLDQDCAAFCDALGIAVPPSTAHHQALRDRLTQEPRWLLIYDNAEDAHDLQAYLPDAGPHHVIITSRQPEWENAQPLRLDVWSDEEALVFLGNRLPQTSDEQRRALANALGGLPLALEQACAYLKKTKASIDDYLAGIGNFDRQFKLLDRADSSVAPHSVQTTLSLAFKRLSQAARDLLHLCAWLAPEAIPEYLFTENARLLPKELAARVGDPLDWRETLAELTSYALCQSTGDGADGPALLFHRLTQAAVQAQRGEHSEDDAGLALLLLHQVFPSDIEHHELWPKCAALLPHVLHFGEWHGKGLQPNAGSLYWLLDRSAMYLMSARGLYGEAEHWQRQALAISQELHGDEDASTLAIMNNLARILSDQGNLAGAGELEESVLEIKRRVLGDEHSATLATMSNLAATRHWQGDLAGARELQARVLAAQRRVQGEEHPATLAAMNNLASTLEAQGDLAGASALKKSALEASQRVLGGEHRETLNAMNNLAVTLHSQGNFSGSRELHERTLAVKRRVLGEEHPDTLLSMRNLASALSKLGEQAKASELEESVLATSRRLLGDEHPDTLFAMSNLATTRFHQGDLAGAQQLAKAALSAYCHVRGTGHPETISTAWNLFNILEVSNDATAAGEVLQSHLLPLLQADSKSLSAGLRVIQGMLRKHFPSPDKSD